MSEFEWDKPKEVLGQNGEVIASIVLPDMIDDRVRGKDFDLVEEISVVGQMAHVPWLRLWKDGRVVWSINMAHIIMLKWKEGYERLR